MIYTFKSKAASDLIMLGASGDQVMSLLGRKPEAKGIFDVADLPRCIALLEKAVAEEAKPEPAADDQEDHTKAKGVTLRARVWPLVEMMRRSLLAREPIVWGV
jgi:hypothetical protein